MTDLAVRTPVKGRSLWGDAWGRLRANRAAVVSAVYLCVMIIACVAGPWISPHGFSTIYQDYVRVPPSFKPYPADDTIEKSLEGAASRARVEIAEWREEGESVVARVTSVSYTHLTLPTIYSV